VWIGHTVAEIWRFFLFAAILNLSCASSDHPRRAFGGLITVQHLVRIDAVVLIMAALRSRCGHYIFVLFLLSSSSFLSPNLSRRRLDVYHTSTHGVALVRISDGGLKRAARGSLKIQDAKMTQKLPSGHHRATLSGYNVRN